MNNLDWSISKLIIRPEEVTIVSKNIHTKALSQDFDANKKSYGKHNRFMSSVINKHSNKDLGE